MLYSFKDHNFSQLIIKINAFCQFQNLLIIQFHKESFEENGVIIHYITVLTKESELDTTPTIANIESLE